MMFTSPADKWYIILEPGTKVQTFFLMDSCSPEIDCLLRI